MFQRRSQRPIRVRRGSSRVACRTTAPSSDRPHGAEFDDAKRLLIEAIAPLHEENRPGAVELDEDGDEDEQRRRARSAPARRTQDRTARFCTTSARDSGMRVNCRLASGPTLAKLDLVELVQDLLGAEMDFDRQRQEGLGAALDDFGRRPRQQTDRWHRGRGCARWRPLRQDRDRARRAALRRPRWRERE